MKNLENLYGQFEKGNTKVKIRNKIKGWIIRKFKKINKSHQIKRILGTHFLTNIAFKDLNRRTAKWNNKIKKNARYYLK